MRAGEKKNGGGTILRIDRLVSEGAPRVELGKNGAEVFVGGGGIESDFVFRDVAKGSVTSQVLRLEGDPARGYRGRATVSLDA